MTILAEPARRRDATYGAMKALRQEHTGVTAESRISMRVVQGIVEAVEEAGVPRAHILRAARIEPGQLESMEASVPRRDVFRLCELALDLTQDPALGLHWGERLRANTFNPISHLIAHAATLRQGFESLSQFHRLVNDQPSFRLSEDDDKVTVYCAAVANDSPRVHRFAAEMLVLGIVKTIHTFSPQARPERVCFSYPAPSYRNEYTRLFERAEHFEQPFTGIVFDRALMDATSPHKDEDVHRALRAVAERRILRLTQRVPCAVRVRDLLVQQRASHRTSMNAVARPLGLSARSLRRRLVAEGKSYNAVLHEALAIVAKQYLRDQQLTIQETAYQMGFADTSTFHRAFKRWTGRTPNAFREEPADDDNS